MLSEESECGRKPHDQLQVLEFKSLFDNYHTGTRVSLGREAIGYYGGKKGEPDLSLVVRMNYNSIETGSNTIRPTYWEFNPTVHKRPFVFFRTTQTRREVKQCFRFHRMIILFLSMPPSRAITFRGQEQSWEMGNRVTSTVEGRRTLLSCARSSSIP